MFAPVVPVSQDTLLIDSAADLATTAGNDGQIAFLVGYRTTGDGGEQWLVNDHSSSDTIDGGFVFAAPTGRWLALDRSVANIKRFGAMGGGMAGGNDDTAFIQQAINSAIVGSEVFFPVDSYLTTGVVCPNRKPLLLNGNGRATINALPGTTTILRCSDNDLTDVPFTVQGLALDGRSESGIIGIESGFTTFLVIQRCLVRGCEKGAYFAGILNSQIQDSLFTGNTFGIHHHYDPVTGGGNANLYSNIEVFGNTVGMVVDGYQSTFGMSGILWDNFVAQNNTHCGLVVIEASNSSLTGAHFELNANAPTTISISGVDIPACDQFYHSANITMRNGSVGGTSVLQGTILEANATISHNEMGQYADSTGQLFRNSDKSDCQSSLIGSAKLNGYIDAPLQTRPHKATWGARHAFLAQPLYVESTHQNDVEQPRLPWFVGTYATQIVSDEIAGQHIMLPFTGEAGDVNSNRMYMTSTTLGSANWTIQLNDQFVISFWIKVSKDCQPVFNLTPGSHAAFAPFLRADKGWQQVVFLVTAVATNNTWLYCYLLEQVVGGVDIAITNMISHFVPASDDNSTIQDIAFRGYGNSKQSGVEIHGDADLNLLGYTKHQVNFETDLTAPRDVLLYAGERETESYLIKRNDAGASPLTIGKNLGTEIATLQAGDWARVGYANGSWVIQEESIA